MQFKAFGSEFRHEEKLPNPTTPELQQSNKSYKILSVPFESFGETLGSRKDVRKYLEDGTCLCVENGTQMV